MLSRIVMNETGYTCVTLEFMISHRGYLSLLREAAACIITTAWTECAITTRHTDTQTHTHMAGRIGTKLTEYLGKEMKKEMGPSYPPKFKQGDMVKMELNKATGVFKCWVNDGEPFMVDGVAPNAKFFVNAEAKSTQFEIQALD
jgi:hypothetical protein